MVKSTPQLSNEHEKNFIRAEDNPINIRFVRMDHVTKIFLKKSENHLEK